MPNSLRTTCAQYLHNLGTTSGCSCTQKNGQCTTGGLYTFCATFTRSPIHSLSISFSSVIGTLIPTVHSPYKEQKLIKLKLINTYLSGELL